MLTARGSMLVVIAAIGMIAGLLASRQQVALAALALLLWIAIHWMALLWLARQRPILGGVQRLIDGHGISSQVLTINQPADVRLDWTMPRDPAGFRIHINDVIPETFHEMQGRTALETTGRARPQRQSLQYRVRPAACGHFELPGLSVQINDWAGLFHWQRFVPCPQSITVLPWMIRPQTTVPVVK